MASETKGVDISLMGRQFRVSCPVDEEPQLLQAVEYLDRKIRDGGKVVGNERIAIMAALNITHEFLSAREGRGFDSGELKRRIRSMEDNLERCFFDQEKLF
jgi:cell division protein ZapA